jgi:hypothetical protein
MSILMSLPTTVATNFVPFSSADHCPSRWISGNSKPASGTAVVLVSPGAPLVTFRGETIRTTVTMPARTNAQIPMMPRLCLVLVVMIPSFDEKMDKTKKR